ncbi:zinc finger protein DPF3-like isoform X2 [Mya arenaria]|uniref:zinc finger protein DPF3-like isoform X2 n=1 Tax=Mya arenaria TaxID=6604 RepID=UPI0022E7CC28|nr:zinc finger protein DPF3-like isoform X2 [Mya arenaria]XP_052780039.1 zinc finger protein DPF3-like isoform X2 [Mya arenaria]
MTEIVLRHSAVQKSIGGSEAFYNEAIEQAANFNLRMKNDRKMRLPFLDSQTGVAQSHTDLWHSYRHRRPGKYPGQIYSYPERRWKKKRHYFLFPEERNNKTGDIETGEAESVIGASKRRPRSADVSTPDMHQISTVENPAATSKADEEIPDLKSETSKDKWYDEYDEYMEPPDAGEMCDDQSDISDFEDTYIKKKKRKGKGSTRGRKKKIDKEEKEKLDEEKEKPYACEVCNARYKTRPGLSYHYNHFHNGMMEPEEPEPSPKSVAKTPPKLEREEPVKVTPTLVFPERGEDGKVQNSNYCDFCLGDSDENKKTGESEQLVSCSDCGRSGHPTCLQFTANMTVSVKKYPWQCIECKSCGLCGTSENDEQLLFCDDCDRGYHMYCLNPPLAEAPEGNWSCHLCIEEFHGGKKPAGMA